MLSLILYILAVVCFAIAAFAGEGLSDRVSLVPLGLAFFALAHIVN